MTSLELQGKTKRKPKVQIRTQENFKRVQMS